MPNYAISVWFTAEGTYVIEANSPAEARQKLRDVRDQPTCYSNNLDRCTFRLRKETKDGGPSIRPISDDDLSALYLQDNDAGVPW